MSGDYSRIDFDPREHDLGVLLQQGRPLSDADWNALVKQITHRLHAGSLDTFGPAVVPMQTPDAFLITVNGGDIEIGTGRMYVDGILAQNHGNGNPGWDARLEQDIGSQPALYRTPPATPIRQQPYLPNPTALPPTGRHLVYLDVWQREVSHVLRADLVDAAVGVDSTTRLQTVWQVKFVPDVGASLGCGTELGQIPGLAPSGARLTIATADVPGQPDPCLVPPDGGYKGLENQLYRVQIHAGGASGTATFKWSRENGSIETLVTHLPALDQLVVESTGRDAVLGFTAGDWIEVTDDWRELHGLPGELRRIRSPLGVDEGTRTIRLETPLTAGLFPTGPGDKTHPGRHTRVKRWDHGGVIRDAAGVQIHDLDAVGSSGEITVPLGATSVLLEHGIVATFSLDAAGGEFRTGDYWVFAARTATAQVEALDAAPPRGIHHHYAQLGFLTMPGTFEDCRVFWPPTMPPQGDGDHCACTVCVTPQQHAAGQPSLQSAIDQVIEAGGGTICLDVGVYALSDPLRIRNAKSLRICGKGNATSLRASRAAFDPILGSRQVTLENFEVVCKSGQSPAIVVLDSAQVTLADLRVVCPESAAIGLSGALYEIAIRRNDLQARIGILGAGSDAQGAGLVDLRIDDNHFDCDQAAVKLTSVSVHQFVSRICGNHVANCGEAGFILTGAAAPGFGVDIQGNSLSVLGDGMHAGIDGLRIHDNLLAMAKPSGEGVGIALVEGLGAKDGLDACTIHGNRIAGFAVGIVIKAPLANATIRNNQIEGAEVGLESSEQSIRHLAIDGNQFAVGKGGALRLKCEPMGEGSSITITGNQIVAESSELSAVMVALPRGDCQFSGNHCAQRVGGRDGCVHLAARTLVVASNRVVGSKDLAMHLVPDEHIQRDKPFPSCTVLGNITGGVIQVRGIALGDPWKPLNLQQVN